jgi:RNA polymerase sigma factor (sigma-70 family)
MRTGSTTESERRALLRAYREDGNTAARDRLIEDFLPLARSLARRYAGRGELTDDLEQVAAVGVIKAIDRFDLSREVDVMSYVFPTVVGELKRHFRDRVWSVSVPVKMEEAGCSAFARTPDPNNSGSNAPFWWRSSPLAARTSAAPSSAALCSTETRVGRRSG